MKEQREIELDLLCELTEDEVQYRAQQLGAAVVDQDDAQNSRSAAMKAFGDQLKEIQQRMRVLSRAIRSRSEHRLVRCTVQFHAPSQAMKRVIRMDTGEIVRDETMSNEECQQHLFEPAEAEACQNCCSLSYELKATDDGIALCPACMRETQHDTEALIAEHPEDAADLGLDAEDGPNAGSVPGAT